MMALAAAIGVGSFVWHTFATRWAELVDVLPIWSFVALYGGVVLYGLLRPPIALPLSITAGAAVFASGMALSMRDTNMLGDTVSGSTQYLPAIFFALATGRMVWKERHPSSPFILLAILFFILSFTFRSLDLPLCSVFPLGTHFLWHVFNCLAFGALLIAMIHFPPKLPASVATIAAVEGTRKPADLVFGRVRLPRHLHLLARDPSFCCGAH